MHNNRSSSLTSTTQYQYNLDGSRSAIPVWGTPDSVAATSTRTVAPTPRPVASTAQFHPITAHPKQKQSEASFGRKLTASILVGSTIVNGYTVANAIAPTQMGRLRARVRGFVSNPFGSDDGWSGAEPTPGPKVFDDGSEYHVKILIVAPKGRDVTTQDIDNVRRAVSATRTAFNNDTGRALDIEDPDNVYYSLDATNEELAKSGDAFDDAILTVVQQTANDHIQSGDAKQTKYLAFYLGDSNGTVAGAAFAGGNAGFIVASDGSWSDPLFTEPSFYRYGAPQVTVHETLHEILGDLRDCQERIADNPAHSADPNDVLDPGGANDRNILHVDANHDGYFGNIKCPGSDLAYSVYMKAPPDIAKKMSEAGTLAAKKGADLGAPTTGEYPVQGGWYVQYERGFIGYTDAHGAFVVSGDMYKQYEANGGFDRLGLPTSGAWRSTQNGERGAAQQFEHGAVFSSNVTPTLDSIRLNNGVSVSISTSLA